MKSNLTYLVFGVDNSGSMEDIEEAMNESINATIREQSKEPGECKCSIFTFDTDSPYGRGKLRLNELTRYTDIKSVPRFALSPGNGTPLRDALCYIIDSVGKELRDIPEHDRPAKVIFVIVTDGKENASVEFSREQLKDRVQEQTNKYAWTFMFQGAEQNAVIEAERYGISGQLALSFGKTSDGVTKMSATTSDKIKRMRGLTQEQYCTNAVTGEYTSYTEEERAEQAKEGAVV